jgi:hypothetical protein
MIDATVSRVRMRYLARRGRFRVCGGRAAAPTHPCAARTPQTGQPAPRTGDPVASII